MGREVEGERGIERRREWERVGGKRPVPRCSLAAQVLHWSLCSCPCCTWQAAPQYTATRQPWQYDCTALLHFRQAAAIGTTFRNFDTSLCRGWMRP